MYENRKLTMLPYGLEGNVFHNVALVLERQFPSLIIQLTVELFVVNQLSQIWHSSGNIVLPVDRNWVWDPNLMSHANSEYLGQLVGDCCIFGVRLFGVETAACGTAECFSVIEKPLNHKVTWMMNRFSSFEPEKAHHSNEFVVGNRKWRIQVHPRGFKEGKDKSFSVYLVGGEFVNNVPHVANTYAMFKLRVLDQVNRNHLESRVFGWLGGNSDVIQGYPEFMPLSKLGEPYLVNDKLYVGVEFELISVTNYC
ncbi:MATH domain and coiled-coil domain-containing protein At3g58200-like isoform X2 [Raphanus sativus]|uniref:MATH domain and coiled-coil domain-containing protein At3g58200-like isoform X2 n=1 Tax=Raphanus sativus TaxID=3726 RepID=A0A9W3DE90_RAPSA|nr:MATH domain and coiled-coil domain-containing protein At3g58200-like isoform X2 [Raphanus sativus]